MLVFSFVVFFLGIMLSRRWLFRVWFSVVVCFVDGFGLFRDVFSVISSLMCWVIGIRLVVIIYGFR